MSQTRGIHVLHVDDEQDCAELVAHMLERQDNQFTVETATSASEGLDRLAGDDFDCIVSDYDLSGQNGIEFLESVREDYPDLPSILIIGKGSEEVASEAITDGITDYFQQGSGTVQYELLANRITNVVAQSPAVQQAATTEHRLRELIETSDDILWMVTADWSEFLYINSAYDDIWGRSRETLFENPTDFLQGVHPEDRGSVTEAMNRLSDGESVDMEFRVNADEEFQRWVWVQAEPIYEGSSDPERIAGFARDVTDRKHQEERFQAFIDHSTDIVTVLDPDGTYQYQSPSSEHVLGYEPDELIGETAFEYVHPDDREEVMETFNEAVANPELRPTIEYRFKHADGSWRWIESVGNNQLDNPAIEGFVVNSRDITEHKENERELQQTRNRMEFALDAIDAVVWDWNVETDQATFYPSEEQLYGTTIDTRADFMDAIHPEDRQQVRDALEYSLETGKPKQEEVRILRDDDVRWIEAPGKPVRDNGTTRMIGVVRDITDRKQKEQKLQRQNERLEQFASIVSHDLRNPLNVVQGRIALAREQYDSEHLDNAAQAVDRSFTLIDDLLTLAREGESVSDVEAVDMAEICESCWRTVETGEATLDIKTDQTIRADSSRLKQLLENLIRNAVEHGGERVTITVGDLDNGFYVADDGPGISKDERDDVFEPGYSTRDEGTGFGLNIVQEIVEAHGWEITVSSSEDGGVRFEITGAEFTEV